MIASIDDTRNILLQLTSNATTLWLVVLSYCKRCEAIAPQPFLDLHHMIELRGPIKSSFLFATMVVLLLLKVADADARDIRWLREDRQNADQEMPRRQSEQWPQGQQKSESVDRRPEGRMSAEERRQLRQDVRDAGREIYPRRR